MQRKRNKTALISMIIGGLYAMYGISYWVGANSNTVEATEAIGAGIATAIIMPHMATATIGALMNVIGYFTNMRGFILAGAILYTVSLALFPPYFAFVVIQMILSYIAFVRMKKVY